MKKKVVHLSGSDWRLVGLKLGVGTRRRLYEIGAPRAAILARVPGDVHDDLQRTGRLPSLYKGLNGRRAKTVPTREWWYFKRFRVPSAWMGMRVLLRFAGADYAACVWLNGQELGRHEGAFTPFEFDVAGVIRPGRKNLLAVSLKSGPREHLKKLFSQHGSGWPHHYAHETRVVYHTHWKSSTNAGWDWGIPIYTLGLWQDVSLVACRDVYLSRPVVLPALSPPYRRADLSVRLRLDSVTDRMVRLRISATCLTDVQAPSAHKDLCTHGREGVMKIATDLPIAEPRLWWPNGYGPQHRYRLDIAALDPDNGETLHEVGVSFGIRDLRLADNLASTSNTHAMVVRASRPPDRANYVPLTATDCLSMAPRKVKLTGKKMIPCRMVINGRSVFGKGGNWVPADLLYGRVKHSDYERLIRQAAAAHFTLFRVWGGGLIEKPEFYDLCDQYGILLFQDFPNGGCRPPEDAASLKVMEQELGGVIPLLANHPSVVRYGFGNELYVTPHDSRQLRLTKKICRQLDPSRPFFGPDPVCTIQRHGPHWFDPAQHYRLYNTGLPENIGPVAPAEWTEFGAAGASCPATLRRMMSRKHIWPIRENDPYWKYHQAFEAYGKDNWLAPRYYRGLFGSLPNLETEVWCSQFMQAEGLRYACQSHRRQKQYRSACTIWSYNEPWPNAAHGCIVEYDGTPKMAYHFVRRAYAPLDASAEYDGPTVKTGCPLPVSYWVVSDDIRAWSGCLLNASCFNLKGDILHEQQWLVNILPDMVRCMGRSDYVIPEYMNEQVLLVRLSLRNRQGAKLAGHVYVFGVIPDGMDLGIAPWRPLLSAPAAKIRTRVRAGRAASPASRRYDVVIRNVGRTPALFIDVAAGCARPQTMRLSDNFMTLFAGESATVSVQIENNRGAGKLSLQPRPLNAGGAAMHCRLP